MKKLLTVLLALAMAFTMVFATAASAEDGYKDSITWVIGNDQDILDPQNNVSNSKVIPQYYEVCWAMTTMATSFARWRKAMKRPRTR